MPSSSSVEVEVGLRLRLMGWGWVEVGLGVVRVSDQDLVGWLEIWRVKLISTQV